MDENSARLLKQAGCFRVWIGAESGSQKVIDAMDRRVKVEQVRAMIQMVKSYGMEAGTFIMLGYPGEDEKDIVDTLDHLKNANPNQYTITVAYPIKGTALYAEVESRFTKNLPWEEHTDRDIDFTRTYNRRYYDHAINWIYYEMRYHKRKRRALGWMLKLRAWKERGQMWREKSKWQSVAV
jgi:anaerobic magnesium-protoporphyrin IX monomethyl ester cyclase